MNRVIVILLGFLTCNLVKAENFCNSESIQTKDIENCIKITNSKIENEIKNLVSAKISSLQNTKICQKRFNEVYPGEEANIERLLCVQEQLNKMKSDLLQTNSEEIINRKAIIISEKAFLYEKPNQVTKSYLVRNDKITILNEQTDTNVQKWYFINYKGKKDINMWIKAEVVDLKE